MKESGPQISSPEQNENKKSSPKDSNSISEDTLALLQEERKKNDYPQDLLNSFEKVNLNLIPFWREKVEDLKRAIEKAGDSSYPDKGTIIAKLKADLDSYELLLSDFGKDSGQE